MTLDELIDKVTWAQIEESEQREEGYRAYTHEREIAMCHQIMNEHIKELEAQIHNMKGDVQDVLYNHIRRTK